jgi:hypothetical protein
MAEPDGEPDYISLEGPVELIEGDFLIVSISLHLAEHLGVGEGSLVVVDNRDHRFRVTRSDANDRDAH